MNKQPIDPRTTRRSVSADKYERNSALYSTYEVVNRTHGTSRTEPGVVVIQKKPEFCKR